MKKQDTLSPYIHFDRKDWAELRSSTPLTIDEDDIKELKGLNDELNIEEIVDIYLPISRLLHLHASATRELYESRNVFLQTNVKKVPYIIGIAGSVAVGKSTMARVLKALISKWPNHPKVDLLTTDGFLYPNEVLKERGLMEKKGFPESYDIAELLHILSDLKSGKGRVEAPVYSHITYNIVPSRTQVINRPDILIVEGINVLQPPKNGGGKEIDQISVSDFFDFSIYVDADEKTIFQWYIERFKLLRGTAFRNPQSYFKKYAHISDEEAFQVAESIWNRINKVNLRENILPTRHRADLILRKGEHHFVESIKMRKI
ncbi:pantothenate kinase [Evansella caseinilytica]|uniref:Pantothenate kinase n=1 Tax=Evansella caseinilytica TaxID=1503961 RepID=A0A1H3V0U1_9BACI|nr:type I pantothenate kinase [Evansella caseinilytica]SDZ68237.1 pantothenate kinase [Evansella caseinilytica]